MNYINNNNNLKEEGKSIISKVLKIVFQLDENNSNSLIDQDFIDKIENHFLFKNYNLEQWNEDDLYFWLYAFVLNTKNSEVFDYLITNDIKNKNNHIDILFEINKRGYLTPGGLKFLMDKKGATSYMKISSNTIRYLLQEEKIILLNIFIPNLKFFDRKSILDFCFYYKYKIPISDSALQTIISNKKFIIDANFRGDYLIDACKSGKEPVIKYLIKHGANVNKENKEGETVLFSASESGQESIVKYLIEEGGADIDKKNNKDETALYYAVKKGHANVVQYLIERGANINNKNRNGENPLFYAIKKGYEPIIKCLVDYGVNVNQKNYLGCTPLFYASKNRYESIVKYLIEHGANVNKVNKNGETPLIYVLNQEKKDKFGAYFGCSVKHKRINENPFITDKKFDNIQIVKCLVEHGANINVMNKEGRTALFYARKNGYELVKLYLNEQGAII